MPAASLALYAEALRLDADARFAHEKQNLGEPRRPFGLSLYFRSS